MSTYYEFFCKECKDYGGFLSRQAWGIGNFNIIETFKFLALHKDHQPYLISEHDPEYELKYDICDDLKEEKNKKFIELTHNYMPLSNDWELVRKNDWKDVGKLWEEKYLENL